MGLHDLSRPGLFLIYFLAMFVMQAVFTSELPLYSSYEVVVPSSRRPVEKSTSASLWSWDQLLPRVIMTGVGEQDALFISLNQLLPRARVLSIRPEQQG